MKKIIYKNGDNVYEKILYPESEKFEFYKNHTPISLKKWNEEMNLIFPMILLEKSPNFIIRLIESYRRDSNIRLVEPKPNEIIADIGCESGYISHNLEKRCKKVYGIDMDIKMLKSAKVYGKHNSQFICSDVNNIAIGDKRINKTVGLNILEHIPKPREGIKELARITKNGGKIIISVPNDRIILFFKKLLNLFHLKFLYPNLSTDLAFGHLHIFDRKALKKICKDLVEIKSIRYSIPFLLDIQLVLVPIRRKK
ncbi:MAG: methyltransferase domain-containing protein [bacterium]|nr:methyltransferase domain-containing protein [bacterium]